MGFGSRQSRSLLALRDDLERDNVHMESVPFGLSQNLLEQCDAVFVIGPTRAFSKSEAEAFAEYLRDGGNLLFALDPVILRQRVMPTGLEEMLKGFGIDVADNIVVEHDESLLPQKSPLERFFVTHYGTHPATQELIGSNAPLVMHQAREINAEEGSGAISILQTSTKASTLSDLQALNTLLEGKATTKAARSVSLAAATTVYVNAAHGENNGTKGVAKGRVAVVGDSDFLSSSYLDAPELTNFYIASALTGWLSQRESLISIPPKKINRAQLDLSVADLDVLWWRVVVLLPSFSLLLGLLVWWRRRA
ncbi:MAG: Gldg family protein [Myxococcales bacterium]|nr:MAG: Gldg family protein [Myxococcales bacterium]